MESPSDNIPIGNALTIWTTLLLLWSSFFVAVRVWAKWQQQWSIADGVFIAGFIAVLAQCTTSYLAVLHGHLGSSPQDSIITDYESWMKILYANNILYVVSMGLSKCSTTLFLRNLSRGRKHNMFGVTLAVIAVLWTVGSTIGIALHGDLTAPWEDFGALYTRWLVVEILGLLIEGLLWLFAFALIWDLNTKLNRRVKLLLIFAARLGLIPIIAVRLDRLSPANYSNSVNDVVIISICAQLALHWALVSECLTCLKPFLQTWHEGVPADSNSGQYWGGLSNMMSVSGTNGKSADHRSRNLSKADRKGEDEGDIKLRADMSGFTTKIASERKGSVAAWTEETEDDIELLPTSRIRVRQTTTMTSS